MTQHRAFRFLLGLLLCSLVTLALGQTSEPTTTPQPVPASIPRVQASPSVSPATAVEPEEQVDQSAEERADGESEEESDDKGPAGWQRRQAADERKGAITIDNIPQVPPDLDSYHAFPWKNLYVKPSGFVEVDFIGDMGNPGNQFSFTPSQIPIGSASSIQTKGFVSLGPSFRLDARRTRFNADVYTPYPHFSKGTRFGFSMDFSGADAAPNIRQAFIAWPNLIIGRTDSVFKDNDAEPETVDPAGPNALIGFRQNAVRFILPIGNYNLAASIEDSGGTITPTGVKPAADGLRQNPDYGFHARSNKDWGHLQLSAILRDLETADFPGTPQRFTGYGLAFSGQVYTAEKSNQQFAISYGDGVGRYINDLAGTRSELGYNAQGQLGTQKAFAAYAAYQHWWSEISRSTAYLSYVTVDVRDGQPGDSYKSGTKLALNWLQSPSKHLTWGAEIMYGHLRQFDGKTGNAGRVEAMVRYRF
jgi:hypothetical protein